MRIAVTNFFNAVYGEAKREQLDALAERYFSEERDYEEDIQKFLKSIRPSGVGATYSKPA